MRIAPNVMAAEIDLSWERCRNDSSESAVHTKVLASIDQRLRAIATSYAAPIDLLMERVRAGQ